MSTELNKQEGSSALHTLPHVDGLTVGIVCAEWNDQITGALLQGALDLFAQEGYPSENITVAHVPGTVELTFGAAQMARTGRYDRAGGALCNKGTEAAEAAIKMAHFARNFCH